MPIQRLETKEGNTEFGNFFIQDFLLGRPAIVEMQLPGEVGILINKVRHTIFEEEFCLFPCTFSAVGDDAIAYTLGRTTMIHPSQFSTVSYSF